MTDTLIPILKCCLDDCENPAQEISMFGVCEECEQAIVRILEQRGKGCAE